MRILEEKKKNDACVEKEFKVIFPQSHPYFEGLKDTQMKAESHRVKASRDKARAWAKNNLVGKFSETKKEMPIPVTITMADVKSCTGKNHKNRAFRNDLLYVLPAIWHELKYIGKARDKDDKHPGTHEWYYYKWKANDITYYFNFRLMDYEKGKQRIGLYAIGDFEPEKD